VAKIRKANGLKGTRISLGTKLVLPGGKAHSKRRKARSGKNRRVTVRKAISAEEPPAGASLSHADPLGSTQHTGTWRPPTEAELAELARGPAKAAGDTLPEVAAPPAVAAATNATTDASNAGESIKDRLLRVARGMLAVPYRYGGTTLWGLDCSGFVQKTFAFLDLGLPRTAREQFREGVKVSKTELSAGDLVFFRTRAKYASHVGIYLGDNRFIHASAHDRKVTIDNLDEPYYEKHYLGAKRLLPEQNDIEN